MELTVWWEKETLIQYYHHYAAADVANAMEDKYRGCESVNGGLICSGLAEGFQLWAWENGLP